LPARAGRTGFDHLKSKGHYLTGYVIMPNHVHALIGFRRNDQSINTIIGNGKRFIARPTGHPGGLMKL
jgi:REP element-mobilizing transposase RayT